MKRIRLCIVLCILLLMLSSVVGFTANEEQFFGSRKAFSETKFSDASVNDWFYPSVKYLYEIGMIDGRTENTFVPQGKMSVAEALALASKVHNAFADVKVPIVNTGDKWYDGYVDYALKNRIILNGNLKSYDDNITRGQMAYIFAGLIPVNWDNRYIYYDLPDVNYKTPYHESIMKLYNYGIIGGKDKFGTFKPNDLITRAEASTILHKIITYLTEINSYTFEEYYLKKTTKLAILENNNANMPINSVKEIYGYYLTPNKSRYFQINESGISSYYKENGVFKKGISSPIAQMQFASNNRGILVWYDYYGLDHWLLLTKKNTGAISVSVLWGEGGDFDLLRFNTKGEMDNYLKINGSKSVSENLLYTSLVFDNSEGLFDIPTKEEYYTRDQLMGAKDIKVEIEVFNSKGERIGIIDSANSGFGGYHVSILEPIVYANIDSNINHQIQTPIVFGESYIFKVKSLIGVNQIEVINDGYIEADKEILKLGDQVKIKINMIDSNYQNVFTGSKTYPITFKFSGWK